MANPPSATSQPIVACQSCGRQPLDPVLFLGYIPPVNTMPLVGSAPQEQTAYPLQLLRCPDCTLVQIGLEVDKAVLFPPSYPYRSKATGILRQNFADLCQQATTLLNLPADALVVDIGSNDGTLLSNFYEAGFPVLGIEPTAAADDANQQGIRTWMRFFDDSAATEAKQQLGPAKLVTAANVFAHIGQIHRVIDAILTLLDHDGVFVSESHYLLGLLETVQYDTVYHEHLRYYSLGSLIKLFEPHGLEVFHVKRIPTHGGSIRVYAAPKGSRPVHPCVGQLLEAEAAAGLADGSAMASFRDRVVASKLDLLTLLASIKKQGQRVYGIGAPSRASTLINYTGLDDQILDCVMEISTSQKLNKYVPGTRIPVLDEAKLYADQPEYALLLSWHIGEELAAILRRKGYRGRFITPLPQPRVLDA